MYINHLILEMGSLQNYFWNIFFSYMPTQSHCEKCERGCHQHIYWSIKELRQFYQYININKNKANGKWSFSLFSIIPFFRLFCFFPSSEKQEKKGKQIVLHQHYHHVCLERDFGRIHICNLREVLKMFVRLKNLMSVFQFRTKFGLQMNLPQIYPFKPWLPNFLNEPLGKENMNLPFTYLPIYFPREPSD